jgi:urocanate hydratase
MGGAQPLAATMAGACCLAVECDPDPYRLSAAHPLRATRRPATLDEALAMIDALDKCGEAKSVGAARQCRRHLPRTAARGDVRPDIVTDQTSAHDPFHGYLPQGWTLAEWREKQESDPKAVDRGGPASR